MSDQKSRPDVQFLGGSDIVSGWTLKEDQNLHFHVGRILVRGLSRNAKSILSIGSTGAPFLLFAGHVERRVSVDPRRPLQAEGVESVEAEFFKFATTEVFDVVICFDVLARIVKPDVFARRLLRGGRTLIVSAPYRATSETHKEEFPNHVDRGALEAWFGRAPNYCAVFSEPANGGSRIFAVFERNKDLWANLAERTSLRRQRALARAEDVARADGKA